ncbi:hypothetical protein Tco_0337706 [Tanacetum coccineum]
MFMSLLVIERFDLVGAFSKLSDRIGSTMTSYNSFFNQLALITFVPDDRYAVSNGSGYAVLICWDEYVVLDRELDMPYPMEMDTPYSTIDQNRAGNNSFAIVLKSGTTNPNLAGELALAIVLDDSCLSERDFSCSLMGKIKDINAVSNLYFILANEGFKNLKLSYIGGQWVLIEMDSIASKEKISKHSGVSSWFHELKPACNSFMSNERLVWISIEGLLIKAFTRNTFAKIVSSWGELTDVEDSDNTSMSYKRLCVKIKSHVIIDAKIKVIVKEKEESSLDDESVCQEKVQKSGNYVNDFEPDNENDIDLVSKSSSDVVEENVAEKSSDELSQPKNDLLDANVGVSTDKSGSCNFLKLKAGGAILEVMDELIKVRQIMGYNMDGCMKNVETIIGSQGFPAMGYSGGILYAWDLTLFVKDSSMVSDSFVVVRGLLSLFPSISALFLDRHLSDHRPILMRELNVDYGPTPFCLFQSWFDKKGFDDMEEFCYYGAEYENKQKSYAVKLSIQNHLADLDKIIDQGRSNDEIVNERSNLLKDLLEFNTSTSSDLAQKAKIRWAIKGDEKSKYFHGIINKRCSQLAIRGVLVEGDWIVEPSS